MLKLMVVLFCEERHLIPIVFGGGGGGDLFLQALLRRQLGQLLDCKKSVLVGFLMSKCMSACVLTHCPSILVGLS